VICNGTEGDKRMEVGKEHANEEWTDLLGWHQGTIKIGEDGWADFKCSSMSVSCVCTYLSSADRMQHLDKECGCGSSDPR